MPFSPIEVTMGKTKKTEMMNYLLNTLQRTIEARTTQVQSNYQKWLDNYAAKPAQETRTTPFYNASNFVPQLIRMHTDILSARIIGMLYGTKPFWRPKSFSKDVKQEDLNVLSTWLEQVSMFDMEFYEPLDTTIFLTVKTGTQTNKATWNKLELYGKNAINSGQVEGTPFTKENLRLDVLPFEDFYPYPITARNLSQVKIKFHRLRLDEADIRYRMNTGWWDKKAGELLLTCKDTILSTVENTDAQSTGISLSVDVSKPFSAIEATINYDIEGNGKMYPIIVVFNPAVRGEESLLKAYYTPYTQLDLDPYMDFRIMPRENSYYAYCVPEILEQSQEEQAQIHNSRRDASTIANVPTFKKKRFADGILNPSTEWYPGKCFEVDDMSDLEIMQFSGNYNHLVEEENQVMALAERYTGISPAMQGMGAGTLGKKGIYANSATLALMSEGNKRLDIYLKRMRFPFHKLGRIIFQSYKDFGANSAQYDAWGENGKRIQKLFEQSKSAGAAGTFFELGASEASANKEVDRTNLMVMANTLGGYYKQIMEVASLAMQAPPGSPVQQLALSICDGARDLSNRLLFVFDVGDKTQLLPDVRKLLTGKSADDAVSTLNKAGVPEMEDPLSVGDVANLSDKLSQVTSSRTQTAGTREQ